MKEGLEEHRATAYDMARKEHRQISCKYVSVQEHVNTTYLCRRWKTDIRKKRCVNVNFVVGKSTMGEGMLYL
jgi:hypothetical protein